MSRSALVAALFDAVSRFDLDGVRSRLHNDFTLELPYEKGMGPLDRDGFTAMLTSLSAQFGRFRMDVVEAVEDTGQDVLVLRYEGDCLSHDGTIAYRNSYAGFFHFADDRVILWREYTNPIISRKMARDFADAGTA